MSQRSKLFAPFFPYEGVVMDVVAYALFCYGLTAVISLMLIGIIIGINRVAGGTGQARNPD